MGRLYKADAVAVCTAKVDNFVTEQINVEEYQDKIDSLEEYVQAIRSQLTTMEEQKTELLNQVLKY